MDLVHLVDKELKMCIFMLHMLKEVEEDTSIKWSEMGDLKKDQMEF